MSQEVFILSARRTPIGAFQGVFAPLSAPQLGAIAAQAALKDSHRQSGIPGRSDLRMRAQRRPGSGAARQAALGAGIPQRVPATTINKMCGSGMKALMLGSDQIRAGSAHLVLAGGLESMTDAPYLLPKARSGLRWVMRTDRSHVLRRITEPVR